MIDVDLTKIKIKTLLIHIPSEKVTDTPLGIPLLRGYLRKCGYRKVYTYNYIKHNVLFNILPRKLYNKLWHMYDFCLVAATKLFQRKPAETGCISVTFGIESMSKRIIRMMNKMQAPDDVLPVLEAFNKVEIPVKANFIIGFPGETEAEAEETVDFIRRHKHLYTDLSIQEFKLEENTDIFQNPDKFGIINIDKEDKYSYGINERYGYKFEAINGMDQKEIRDFINRITIHDPVLKTTYFCGL
ncbi:radical SAM protein [Candidatus Margulisiibacteriota bacterium]